MTSPVTSRVGGPPGHRPRHRPHRPAGPDLRVHRPGPGGQPGPPGHCRPRPATASRRRPASTARRISAPPTGSSGASATTRTPTGEYVDAAGRPADGRGWRSRPATRGSTRVAAQISAPAPAGRDRRGHRPGRRRRRDGRGRRRPTPTTWPWSPGWPVRSRRPRRPGTPTARAPVGSDGTEDWSNFDDPQVDQLFTPGGPGPQPGHRGSHLRPDRRPAVGPDGGPAPVRRAGLRGQRGAAGQCPVQPLGRRDPLERGRCGPP